jgi:hypothetical protein
MIMETLVSAARGIVNVLAKLKQAFVDSTTMLNNTDTNEVHKQKIKISICKPVLGYASLAKRPFRSHELWFYALLPPISSFETLKFYHSMLSLSKINFGRRLVS